MQRIIVKKKEKTHMRLSIPVIKLVNLNLLLQIQKSILNIEDPDQPAWEAAVVTVCYNRRSHSSRTLVE